MQIKQSQVLALAAKRYMQTNREDAVDKHEQIRLQRQSRYITEADPLRLDWNESSARGEEQAEEKKQLWLAKKDEIRNDLPYIEEAD